MTARDALVGATAGEGAASGAPLVSDNAVETLPAAEPAPLDLAAALPPELNPTDLETRATYRLLTLRGFASTEASNLTAYMAGVPLVKTPWSMKELNRLLFLRHLYRSEHWQEYEQLL